MLHLKHVHCSAPQHLGNETIYDKAIQAPRPLQVLHLLELKARLVHRLEGSFSKATSSPTTLGHVSCCHTHGQPNMGVPFSCICYTPTSPRHQPLLMSPTSVDVIICCTPTSPRPTSPRQTEEGARYQPFAGWTSFPLVTIQ